MNECKIKIKSNQIFEEHVDSIEEEYKCVIEKFENGMKIVYDNNEITVKNGKVIIERENTQLTIEKNVRNVMKYQTPYGTIDIEVEGKEIEIYEKPLVVKLSYFIKVGNAKEYKNELQIVVE